MGGVAITLSVVSHRQNRLVNLLLADLARLQPAGLAIIATQNVDDPDPLVASGALELVRNARPRGFGENHNAAFRRCATPYFCVVNPDVRLTRDPFPELAAALETSPNAGVAGPRVHDAQGRIEDSARRFPTVGRLLVKLLAGASGPDYPVDQGTLTVDWVAGMFMLFRSEAFRAASGFDERFFLYYEDVDICRRLGLLGFGTVYVPGASVVHEARRASRRDARLMRVHAASAARYLMRRYR
jgi:N-acetylglucosaminyl-diphospho-decaprenol L-rhamnosyltransferase